MARLYKNGYELVRMERKIDKYCEIYKVNEVWTLTECLMSNGYILKKFKVTSEDRKRPSTHNWKRAAKLIKGKTLADFIAFKEKVGYHVITK